LGYILCAASVHDDLEIISFEPSTSNLRVLSRNISINNLSNKVRINQLSLCADSNTNAIMYEPNFVEGWSMNSFGESIDYEGKNFISEQKYSLYGTNIDFYIENKILKVPNYIKIDVDGIEHKILQGAKTCLSDKKLESISIELNENYQEQYEIIIKIMAEFDFKLKHKKHAKILIIIVNFQNFTILFLNEKTNLFKFRYQEEEHLYSLP
jgi:FkbM family methyltransferase